MFAAVVPASSRIAGWPLANTARVYIRAMKSDSSPNLTPHLLTVARLKAVPSLV